jgi:hypothetical protein
MNNSEVMKKPKGEIGMILYKDGEYDIKAGKVVGGKVIREEKFHNLIVDKASEFMSCRMAPGTSPNINGDDYYLTNEGMQYLAVGVGILKDPTKAYDIVTNPIDTNLWDLQNPQVPTADKTQLNGEIFRKKFTGWSFIDQSGSEVVGPTNMLKLVVTFDESEAVGPLTEMGLFGGNATTSKDSGFMFNYKTFAVWNKTNDARLTITWKLTF